MYRSSFRMSVVLMLTVLMVAAGSLSAFAGEWITGDFHTHTFLTDGSHTQADVVGHAFDTFGLDWMANSEHGGTSARNPEGVYWENVTPSPYIIGNPVKDKNGRLLMWRWQSLRDYSYPLLQALQSRYPNKTLIQGLEWNVPSHEHASVAIIEDNR